MREQLKEQENFLHGINTTHFSDKEKYLTQKTGNEKAPHSAVTHISDNNNNIGKHQLSPTSLNEEKRCI